MTQINIIDRLDDLHEEIEALVTMSANIDDTKFEQVLTKSAHLVGELLNLYVSLKGKTPNDSKDLLEVFKTFVKGDPSLNAVRDNVREIVYYQNCLAQNREDALPKNPAKMAARTTQHIYFYLRSRLEQEVELD